MDAFGGQALGFGAGGLALRLRYLVDTRTGLALTLVRLLLELHERAREELVGEALAGEVADGRGLRCCWRRRCGLLVRLRLVVLVELLEVVLRAFVELLGFDVDVGPGFLGADFCVRVSSNPRGPW